MDVALDTLPGWQPRHTDAAQAQAPRGRCPHIDASLRQQPPFRYVDAVVRSDLASRRSSLGLWLEAGQARICCDDGLPGFLLIEAMAQASGVLLRRLSTGHAGGLLVGMEDVHLPEIVAFPAHLEIDTQLVGSASHLFDFSVCVTSRGAPLARAHLRIASQRTLDA